MICTCCAYPYAELRKFRCGADSNRRVVDDYMIRKSCPGWCPLAQSPARSYDSMRRERERLADVVRRRR